MRAPLAFVVALALAACADFPALDATLSPTTAAALTARAAALRARAARLSGSVVSRADKARLRSDVRLPNS